MRVKLVDIQKQYQRYKTEIDARVHKVLEKGDFIHGKDVSDFEKNFSKYIGVANCIGVGNGTDALELAMQSLNFDKYSKDDEIMVPGNTYIASCLGAINNNFKLRIIDCDPFTHMMCYEDIVKQYTPHTKALIIVHLFGIITADIEKIQQFCKEKDITLIEDCAQAHGAQWKGKCAGTFGKVSCFSFYPGKNLGAFGDGGAICTNDNELATRIRKLANLGCAIKYHHEIIGRNSRLDTIQAAILDEKLKHLEDDNNKRRMNAQRYNENLLEMQKCIQLPKVHENCKAVFHLYVIKTQMRDALKQHLESLNIECGIHYPISITETDAFKHLNLSLAKNSIQNSKEILSLPMHSELTNEEIDYVCNCIKLFFNNKISFKKCISSKPGMLYAINTFPFNTKRIFYVELTNEIDINLENKRGLHSNINFDEFLFVAQGSLELNMTFNLNGNIESKKVIIDEGEGIVIYRNTWIEYAMRSNNTKMIVLANECLELSKSCHNFDEFIATK